MKTLAQIEPRTPISSAPTTLTQPGSYYLTTNIAVTTGNAITITADNVTLDLNGFTASSTEASPAGTGIMLSGDRAHIHICNGHIKGNVTYSGGFYSGNGFSNGIKSSGNPRNVRVTGVSVSGCLNDGINVGLLSTVAESCTVSMVGGAGILADSVTHSTARLCGGSAISASSASDCSGEATGAGAGVTAPTVQNCNGSSATGPGVYANNAQNCYGLSNGQTGLFSVYTALNCYGQTGILSTYPALNAQNASFCVGSHFNGTAIQAVIATGCIAQSGTNNITYKYNMP